MRKIEIYLLLTICLIVSTNTQAQSGPIVPCVDCEQYTQRTVPLNGLWYNPEQSGVGISIELQKNTLFGTYYGYDETGDSVWYTFVGQLEKSSDPETMWSFESTLSQFENGTCANCEYQAPSIKEEFQSTIQFKFKHKNYASFSINNGEEQSIIPIIFTTLQSADFTEITSFKIPELTGLWNFTYNLNVEGFSDVFIFTQIILITSKGIFDNIDGTREVSFPIALWDTVDSVFVGDITCKTSLNNENKIIGPTCIYYNGVGVRQFGNPVSFKFPLSGLGDQRLFGEDENGDVFEAVKLDLRDYH